MRRVHGAAIRARREALELSRVDLADAAGATARHVGKIERGEVVRVKPALLSGLSLALGVKVSEIAEPRERTDAQQWADEHGYTLLYAYEFARDGRIEGHTRMNGDTGIWKAMRGYCRRRTDHASVGELGTGRMGAKPSDAGAPALANAKRRR